MLKQFFITLMAIVIIPILSGGSFASSITATPKSVITNSEQPSEVDIDSGIIKARIEQILNLNRIYDNGFENDREIIEEISIVLLDQAEEDVYEQKYIKQAIVTNFIDELYGIKVNPAAAVYEYLPAPEGYFAIPAKGFSTLKHSDIEFVKLGNGDIAVSSVMTIGPHDSYPINVNVKTILRPVPDSAFGYNILSSDITE